jgi:hypothetical protein
MRFLHLNWWWWVNFMVAEDRNCTLLWNTDKTLPDYTASQPRWQLSVYTGVQKTVYTPSHHHLWLFCYSIRWLWFMWLAPSFGRISHYTPYITIRFDFKNIRRLPLFFGAPTFLGSPSVFISKETQISCTLSYLVRCWKRQYYIHIVYYV